MIETTLVAMQLCMLVVQFWCIMVMVKTESETMPLYGFGIWGSVPNLAIMAVVLSIP